MKRHGLSAIALAAGAVWGSAAQAYESERLVDSTGASIFEVRFFGPDDGAYGEITDISRWKLADWQREQIKEGIQYWADVIKVVPGQAPAILNVGTTWQPDNAFGDGRLVRGAPVIRTQAAAALQNQPVGTLVGDTHGVVGVGTIRHSKQPFVASQIPLDPLWDLPSTVVHEVGHVLGVLTDSQNKGTGSHQIPVFGATLTEFESHLRDDNGNPARAGQYIACTGCAVLQEPDVFDVTQDRGYFTGAHVSEVLADAMPGVPVRMLDASGDVDESFMSHLELKNSMMSHQTYANFTSPMEAELALMQDLGYTIDRRNFFGRSVYGSGLVLTNDDPYFGRNAAGTAYVPDTFNTAKAGLGLHVYGSHNVIVQRANLLSSGQGGAGIRVDGENNTVTIAPGTRVHASGPHGRAVMFAYGKHHTFVQRGDVEALGQQGIAASFDFGHNSIGDESEYRGSYFHTLENQPQPQPLPAELDGPLVRTFDLTGRLAGNRAAIYLSESGYVERINVMRGASLSGNILSSYTQNDADGAPRLTTLTFGLLSDANGRATDRPDAAFSMRYDGDIVGAGNLVLKVVGGTSTLNGQHSVHNVNIAPGATLNGNGSFVLNAGGAFVNEGTLEPWAAGADGSATGITVDGDFTQTPTGRVVASATGSRRFSRLVVRGAARLDGALVIAPQRGWYPDGFHLASDEWVSSQNVTGRFARVTASLDSPTLVASASDEGNNTHALDVSRVENAYSRHGEDDNSRQVGRALDRIAGEADTGMRPLLAALDFSAPDGSDVTQAIRQLSPAPYGAMFTGALMRVRQITDIVVGGAGMGVNGNRPTGAGDAPQAARRNWRTFAASFGSGYRRSDRDDMPAASGNTYGVIVGAETVVDDARHWMLGAHAAVSGQSTRMNAQTTGSGKATAFDVGAHARYAPDPVIGPHAFALARIGVEDGRMQRSLWVNGFTSSSRGTWLGTAATASVGAGWRWALGSGLSAGLLAALDYSTLHRSRITETGEEARLRLAAQTVRSLRARLGGELRFDGLTSGGKALSASLQAMWGRELMNGAFTQAAAFAAHPSIGFGARNDVVGRDSLGLQAGLAYQLDRDVTIRAAASGSRDSSGDADVAGWLNATWQL